MTTELRILKERHEKGLEEWRAHVDRCGPDMSDDDRAKCDEYQKNVERLEKDVRSLARLEEGEASVRVEPVAVLAHSEPIASSNPMENRVRPGGRETATAPLPGDSPFLRPSGGFRNFGEQLQAIVTSSQPGGRRDNRLQNAVELRATGSSEGIGSEGGFWVQIDYKNAAAQQVRATSEILQRVDTMQISANSNSTKINAFDEVSRVDGSRFGGVLGYWLSEAASKTKSKPKWRQIELVLKKVICLWYATDELLQDATAMTSVAAKAFMAELKFQVEAAIVGGSGAGQCLGILNSPCRVSVSKEIGQAAATITSRNIVDMWARHLVSDESKVCWLVNRDCFPSLYQMGITIGVGGSPLFVPAGGMSASPYNTLLGKPIIPVEYCETLGTVGDIILADLSEYQLADKGGIQASSSIHVQFTTDETTFRWVFRVDGQPKRNAPLTPYKGTDTVSPFVVLATRA